MVQLFRSPSIADSSKFWKVGLLQFLFFYFFESWDPLNQDASDHVLGVFGKVLTRGVHELDSMTFGLAVPKVLEY